MKTGIFIAAGLANRTQTITRTRHFSFRRACLLIGLLAFAMIAFGPQPAKAAVSEAWVQHYGSEAGSADDATKVVTDAAGNVIVAGTTWQTQTGSASDMLIIKYSGAGVPLWTNRYDGPGNYEDVATAVAVDASGNVFVTGYSAASGGSYAYATIAFSSAGVPLWTNRYGEPNARATAVAVDGSGNVFVTGSSLGSGGYDYATVAYSGAGVPLWTNRYNGPANSSDFATALAVDASGNVFVTGSSDSVPPGPEPNFDYATVAYSGAGVPLWTERYNGPGNGYDIANAVAVDASGNVFVTGYSDGGGFNDDYATIAYSGAGAALWTNRYGGPGDTGDIANSLAVDGSGKVFVTGSSATIAYSGAGAPLWTNDGTGTAIALDGSGKVFVTGSSATIAYSGAGALLWTNDGPGTAIALDGSGNVFVTGNSPGSGGDTDYATIAYAGTGAALWTNRYGGRGEASDIANAVALDGSGNVFVTGSSASVGSGANYATIAYSGAGVPLWTNRGPADGFNDQATAVAVDASGNVFVTGNSGDDYATIAYSGAGVALWTNRYNGTAHGFDQAIAMAVDGSGNVFVTGSSYGSGGNWDYATIAYSGAGVPLWTNRYDGPGNGDDQATAIAVGGGANVFVTGSSSGDYATIAYSGAGVPFWTNRYNGPASGDDSARAVAVDGSGHVLVTGSSYASLGNEDYATIAYSGSGLPLWTNHYDGPNNLGDSANAVAVDGNGIVFVTGASGYSFGIPGDYATIAYSSAGVALWTNRYSGPANGSDQASAVAVDASGNVYVTGSSVGSGGDGDYATIVYSGAGVPLGTNRYNGQPQTLPSLAIGSDGAIYVTGASAGHFSSDFAIVKYVWQPEIAIQLLSTNSPTVNLTLSGAPNSPWAIERAPQLTGPWKNLSALLIGTNGSAQFQDTNPPAPAGFYRARLP